MTISPATYTWLVDAFTDHEIELTMFSAMFVTGLTPVEVFQRLGLAPAPADGFPALGDMDSFAAYETDGGSVLAAVGWELSDYELGMRLSVDTAIVSLYIGVNKDRFTYFADGQEVTEFEVAFPQGRSGSDPDRLVPHLQRLGMPVDEEDDDDGFYGRAASSSALALAAIVTGAHLTPAHLTRPGLTGTMASLL